MQLNHLNLVVTDVPQAVRLFETCFGFRADDSRSDAFATLTGADGFVLVLMRDKTGDAAYPEVFHFGFLQTSEQAVTEIYAKLQAHGISLERPPGKVRNGFGFYFHFDLLMIEIGCYA